MYEPDRTPHSPDHLQASVLFLRKPVAAPTVLHRAMASLSGVVFGILAYSIAWIACVLFEVKDAAHEAVLREAEAEALGAGLQVASSR